MEATPEVDELFWRLIQEAKLSPETKKAKFHEVIGIFRIGFAEGKLAGRRDVHDVLATQCVDRPGSIKELYFGEAKESKPGNHE